MKLKPQTIFAAILIISGLMHFWPGTAVTAPAEEDQQLRVLISESEGPVKLTIHGGYTIRDFKTKENLSDSQKLEGVNIRALPDGLMVAGVRFPQDIEIHGDDPNDLAVEGRPFRGYLTVHLRDNQTLFVVNHIDVEDYLYGVLFHEVGFWWPMAALKAQAVASRTYALNQKQERRGKLFDLYNNQRSQMYGGAGSERSRSTGAVDATRAEVLTYEGKIFPTFYHATCGGMTRDASELWNVDLPPLDGGVKCSSCWFSPHYAWQAKLGHEELEDILKKHDVEVGGVHHLDIVSRTPSRRVDEIKIKGSRRHKTLKAKDLRLWIGPRVVRSEDFDVRMDGDEVIFKGNGWGHGVGMCQWGALGQSIMRKKYDEILEFYYPGSEIKKIYS